MSVFGVILVRIFHHSDWIRRDTPYNNSEYGHFYAVQIYFWFYQGNSDMKKKSCILWSIAKFDDAVNHHCVKSVQKSIVFSCIRTEYRKIRTRKNSVFGNFSRSALYPLSFDQMVTQTIIIKLSLNACSSPQYSKHKNVLKVLSFSQMVWRITLNIFCGLGNGNEFWRVLSVSLKHIFS